MVSRLRLGDGWSLCWVETSAVHRARGAGVGVLGEVRRQIHSPKTWAVTPMQSSSPEKRSSPRQTHHQSHFQAAPAAHPPRGSLCRSCSTPASSSGKTLPCTLHTRAWNGFANTTDSLASASQEFSPAYRKEQKWGKGSFLPTCHVKH